LHGNILEDKITSEELLPMIVNSYIVPCIVT